VSVYQFDEVREAQRLETLRFDAADGDWLDFVNANRLGTYDGKKFDLIVGPVANDDIFPTLQAFQAGLFTREQTLEALKVRQLYDQYVFVSELSIGMLEFVRAYTPQEVRR
jgi:hypothetical protein